MTEARGRARDTEAPVTDDVARHLSPWARRPAEPSTEAGKRLLKERWGVAGGVVGGERQGLFAQIAAVEAEAVAARNVEIAAAVWELGWLKDADGWPDPRIAALAECPICFDSQHLGKCPDDWCDCYLGPIAKDPTLLDALNAYINDEGNHVGGVWGDYGQVVVDTSDLWSALTGKKRDWERSSEFAATMNQMREALEDADPELARLRAIEAAARALLVACDVLGPRSMSSGDEIAWAFARGGVIADLRAALGEKR